MYLGIDVSKATLDVMLLTEAHASKGRHRTFGNTASGHKQLLRWLSEQQAVGIPVCLEATGTYAQAVARKLHEAGYCVSLVNPAQVYAFGKSQLKRAKTDKADALLLARFVALQRPSQWTPPTAEMEELQALMRRLESLEEMKRMEQNRLESAKGELVIASLEEHIAYLQRHIEGTKEQIQQHIGSHASLREQNALLCSIPGIGPLLAACLLAEVGEVSRFSNARQIAAFVGLAPRVHESGTSVRLRTRLCKKGCARLRKALYFPAMCAVRFNPIVREMAKRLTAQGKCKMLILGAAMRKLLCLAYGVLKSKQPFDTNFCYQNP